MCGVCLVVGIIQRKEQRLTRHNIFSSDDAIISAFKVIFLQSVWPFVFFEHVIV